MSRKRAERKKYVLLDIRYWLDTREVVQLSDSEWKSRFLEYINDPKNVRYENHRSIWSGKQRKELTKLVMSRDKNECRYCGATDNLTIDHIIPLSRGGTNDPSNLQILCKSCNCRKSDKVDYGEL